MINGKYAACGASYSTGLEFKLDGKGYAVEGIGKCEDTDIIIPETYNGLPVIAIAAYAFTGCKDIINVTLPNGITTIEQNAFQECESLVYVNILDNIKSIELEAFAFCTELTYAIIGNGLEEVGYEAFQDCLRLKDINIPSSVISIGDDAFNTCSNLASVALQDGLRVLNIARLQIV